jgi:hypothetical protein
MPSLNGAEVALVPKNTMPDVHIIMFTMCSEQTHSSPPLSCVCAVLWHLWTCVLVFFRYCGQAEFVFVFGKPAFYFSGRFLVPKVTFIANWDNGSRRKSPEFCRRIG